MVVECLNWIINILIPGLVSTLFAMEIVDNVVSIGSMIMYFGILYFVLKFIIGRISKNDLNYATEQEHQNMNYSSITTEREVYSKKYVNGKWVDSPVTKSVSKTETGIKSVGRSTSRRRKKYK